MWLKAIDGLSQTCTPNRLGSEKLSEYSFLFWGAIFLFLIFYYINIRIFCIRDEILEAKNSVSSVSIANHFVLTQALSLK